MAGDEPLLIVVDDLHWCDRPSLRYLAYLVKRLEGLPVSVAASLRPAEPGADAALLAELTTDPLAISLHPAGLSREAAAALIADQLGAAPEAEFTAACHTATGGNPLLLSELLRALRAEGVTPEARHAEAVREIGPRAASRSVLLRLSRLEPGVIAVARAVAVLGEGAEAGHVAALCATDRVQAVTALGELARVEILRPGTPVGFVHPLVRAAVYNDLPPAERESLHERAARVLADAGAGPDRIASQLLSAPGRGDAWVVETLIDAARTALGRAAPESAATYLTRALAEPPAPDARPGLLLQLGITESMSNGPPSVEHLQAAYETSTDPLTRARAAAALAPIHFFLGKEAEGVAIAARAAEGLGPEHASLRHQLDAFRLTAAIYDPAHMRADDPWLLAWRTHEYGEDPGSRLAEAITAYHWAMTGGPRDVCLALARHALSGQVLASTLNGSIPHVGAQLVLMLADAEDTLDRMNEAWDWAHRTGSLIAITPARMFRGFALGIRGDLEEAEALIRAGLRENDVWGFVSVRLFPGSLLAQVLVERDDLTGARTALEHAAGDGRLPENTNAAWWFNSRLRYLAALGAWDELRAAAEECRTRFSETVTNPAWLPWRSHLARAIARDGRTEEAVALCEEELRAARDWGACRPISLALRTLGGLLGEDGLPHLEEAVAVTAGTPARVEHAHALADLGTALRLARRPTEAREPLQRALDLATVSGATALAGRARTELQATGVRPRTDALSGAGSLTASERRVAEAAAAGQTNKDIAQALYVTPKTVEVHLSNAYRKLGIRSRRELGAALAGA
ncbi:MAG: LuxR C-terminal-related transcriptional regulator [Thermoleophilia bacterium]